MLQIKVHFFPCAKEREKKCSAKKKHKQNGNDLVRVDKHRHIRRNINGIMGSYVINLKRGDEQKKKCKAVFHFSHRPRSVQQIQKPKQFSHASGLHMKKKHFFF